MSRSMTRKEFLAMGLRGTGAAMTLILVGCADEDDDVGTDVTGTTMAGTTVDDTTAATGETTGMAETSVDETTGTATETTGADDTTTAAEDTVSGPVCDEVEAEVGPPSVGPDHGHVVTIPAEDVVSGRTTTYMLSMDLGHLHEVTVTEAMFALLLEGQEVVADTDLDATQHAHAVTITCA